MDDPLKQPPPSDPIERIHALARDLAYGALNKLWGSRFNVSRKFEGRNHPTNQPVVSVGWYNLTGNYDAIDIYISNKWSDEYPPVDLLISFGYLQILDIRKSNAVETYTFLITQEAFALLSKPATPPTVFVSYSRKYSSALGLLIVERLKNAGVSNPFIDMNIQPGDVWHAKLEEIIRQSRYFIVLLASGTLDSRFVRQEIEWARATPGITIIPIWQPNYVDIDKEIPELGEIHAIRVKEESAQEYDTQLRLLLNRLGYGP
ncbi:MAG: toll/interleukin-1 receptor domain-containing protein [Anaerolineae bacterium]|nr:toll/interleukin-1 receptor domain-containing protein [Anaerolineae bacterium]